MLYEAPRDLPHEMATFLMHLTAPKPIEDANGAATEQVRNSLDADKETGSFKPHRPVLFT